MSRAVSVHLLRSPHGRIHALPAVAVLGAAAIAALACRRRRAGAGQSAAARPAVATFAGGCFWCMEAPFDKLPGVRVDHVGYTGGKTKNPTYEEVSAGVTGHAEAVQVVYDPTKVSYEKLLDVFWHNIDPTVKDRQFCDIGTQYRTAIFVQRRQAAAARRSIQGGAREVEALQGCDRDADRRGNRFLAGRGVPPGLLLKNPVRYNYYRTGCGRDRRLAQLWGSSPH